MGLTYEIEQEIAIVSVDKSGWSLELNLVSWNGRPAKYDLRKWSADHEKMGKGVTLSKEEAISLGKILSREFDLREKNEFSCDIFDDIIK